ncbi:unnamed protein product [Parnassius apollo]|uniref:(apollo) hypothetical protein n=1 Tax=Parnassius apollo TaxID=110799 RepID=A0A8S3VZB5_PARAO|nr:unnamed protein product [Parnassius apollo]
MSSFQARLESSQPNITSLTNDFIMFKETIKTALEILKKQVQSLILLTDDIDNRSRRKFLLIRGIEEYDTENCIDTVVNLVTSKLKIHTFRSTQIHSCYRLGKNTIANPRALLVKFTDYTIRQEVWRAKLSLKGSNISIAEFLTPHRRELFKEARRLHGMHRCWTQDSNIYLKLCNGSKVRLVSLDQLAEYPVSNSETSKAVASKQRSKPGKKL